MHNGLVAGRTAVVTGAAQGIGLANARLPLHHGAAATLVDLDPDRLATAAAALDAGDRVHTAAADVTDPAAIDAALAGTVDRFGGLDILVNNAGITRDKSLAKMTLDEFSAV